MAYIVYTDEAYKRDFYHYTLRGHYEGIGIVVDKGFEWKEEDGEVKSISIRYPINPYWYELGNKPDYLSSRKIYWYRAWLTYWLEGPEITIYGEWVQFTSINPMCTGFTNFDAKRMMKKYYSYHGIIMPCKIPANPGPKICEEIYIPYGPTKYATVKTIFVEGWRREGYPYLPIHDAIVGDKFLGYVGQLWSSTFGIFWVGRLGMGFEVTGLPANYKLVRVGISLQIINMSLVPDFDIVLRSGMPEFPHVIPDLWDYNKDHYSGNGGSMSTVGANPTWLPFNELGYTWIKSSGISKFVLVSQRDIDSIQPHDYEFVQYRKTTASVRLYVGYKEPL